MDMETNNKSFYLFENQVSPIFTELVSTLDFEVSSFETFAKLNKLIKSFLNKKYSSRLNWKTSDFIQAFEESCIWFYHWSKEWRAELMHLIMEKKKHHILVMKNILNAWLLDKFISPQDKATLLFYIDSNIVNAFNEIFFNREESVKDIEVSWGLYYGGYRDWQVIWYWAFLQKEHVNTEINVPENNVWHYINGIVWLIQQWITDETSWLAQEDFYLKSWLDESNLWITWSLENYNNVAFVDPEIDLVIKKSIPADMKQCSVEMSRLYFWDSYGMETCNIFEIEPFLGWGDVAFGSPLWRNFPNWLSSKNKYGTMIYFVSSAIYDSYDIYKPTIQKFVEDFPDHLKSEILVELKNKLVYHEMGHNLFVINPYHDKSNLEEMKAEFFYFVYLCDRVEKWAISYKSIVPIIYSFILNILKNFARYDKPQFYKYVLLNTHVYNLLKQTGILKYENNKLVLNFDVSCFKTFVEKWVATLHMIKDIYENQDLAGEKNYIELIEQENADEIKEIVSLLQKK